MKLRAALCLPRGPLPWTPQSGTPRDARGAETLQEAETPQGEAGGAGRVVASPSSARPSPALWPPGPPTAEQNSPERWVGRPRGRGGAPSPHGSAQDGPSSRRSCRLLPRRLRAEAGARKTAVPSSVPCTFVNIKSGASPRPERLRFQRGRPGLMSVFFKSGFLAPAGIPGSSRKEPSGDRLFTLRGFTGDRLEPTFRHASSRPRLIFHKCVA